jgi:hypothetical protein
LPATTSPGGLECMNCNTGGNAFQQAGSRSTHQGVHVAMCDGSVQFISNDIETTGCYQRCCSVWDNMISSGDSGATTCRF